MQGIEMILSEKVCKFFGKDPEIKSYSHFPSLHLTQFFGSQDICWERIDSQSVCKSHRFTPFSTYSFISASIYNKFVHSSLFSSENVRCYSDFFPRNFFFVRYNSENFPRNFVSVGRYRKQLPNLSIFCRRNDFDPT